MSESSTSMLSAFRFPILGTLAVAIFGLVVLAPKYHRNQVLEREWTQEQLRLIELEQRNEERERFLEQLEENPELISRLNGALSPGLAISDHAVPLPPDLAIHPDALLRPDGPESSGKRSAENHVSSVGFVEWISGLIAGSQVAQRALLGISMLLLLLATVPLPPSVEYAVIGTARFVSKIIGSRYRVDAAHHSPSAPKYMKLQEEWEEAESDYIEY